MATLIDEVTRVSYEKYETGSTTYQLNHLSACEKGVLKIQTPTATLDEAEKGMPTPRPGLVKLGDQPRLPPQGDPILRPRCDRGCGRHPYYGERLRPDPVTEGLQRAEDHRVPA